MSAIHAKVSESEVQATTKAGLLRAGAGGSSALSAQWPASRHEAAVLDSFITYREAGSGLPMVLLHGNPTSSHVYRNVIPALSSRGRCLAPDLIGMGDSGKPPIAYRYSDHFTYLDAWFDVLNLKDVVLIGYDWGGVLAMDWASRHPHRVRGLVVFETFLRPMRWSDWPPQGAELFRAYRTPGVGEAMVLERNEFLTRSLEFGVKTGLAEADRAVYSAPYPDASSRRPLLQWPREIPIDGEPADVHAIVERCHSFLLRTKVPKLLLTFGTGGLSTPALVDSVRPAFDPQDLVDLGPAGHHAPEDAPTEIARAVEHWLDRHRL